MDDTTFDRKSALEWIGTIEAEGARIRENDIYPRLNTWLNNESANDVLEIGCGQGVCSDKIDLKNHSYTGVDPSPYLVARANELYKTGNRHFTEGNAYALPLSDASFDAAFSVAVWHLLGDLRKASDELSRVLKPGGRFLIISANPDAYSSWTDSYTDARMEGRRFEGSTTAPDGSVSRDVLYLHTIDEITQSLLAFQLSIQSIETFRMADKSGGKGKLISIIGRKREDKYAR